MDSILFMLFMSITLGPAMVFCFWYSKYIERLAWNKLIDDGIISKPGRIGGDHEA